MKLFEILCENCLDLFEGRIETLIDLYKDRVSSKLQQDGVHKPVISFIHDTSGFDPTTKKIYTQWMLNSYLKDEVKAEDLYKCRNDLIIFDKFKNKLQIKDINKYTPRSLYQAVKDLDPQSAASNRQQKQQIKTEGADVVMKGPDCTILKLKTKEAACYYGKGTRWCTAADKSENAFNKLNKHGPIYVAMCDDGRKFQIQIATWQFMDEQDDRFDIRIIRNQYPTIDLFFKNIAEPEILTWASFSYYYIREVIKARWPEAEPIIMKNAEYAWLYARYVIKGRWPEAEPYIMKNAQFAKQYKNDFGIQ
jgi:hypothetical protein